MYEVAHVDYEVVDHWTLGPTLHEYTQLLDALFEATTRPHTHREAAALLAGVHANSNKHKVPTVTPVQQHTLARKSSLVWRVTADGMLVSETEEEAAAFVRLAKTRLALSKLAAGTGSTAAAQQTGNATANSPSGGGGSDDEEEEDESAALLRMLAAEESLAEQRRHEELLALDRTRRGSLSNLNPEERLAQRAQRLRLLQALPDQNQLSTGAGADDSTGSNAANAAAELQLERAADLMQRWEARSNGAALSTDADSLISPAFSRTRAAFLAAARSEQRQVEKKQREVTRRGSLEFVAGAKRAAASLDVDGGGADAATEQQQLASPVVNGAEAFAAAVDARSRWLQTLLAASSSRTAAERQQQERQPVGQQQQQSPRLRGVHPHASATRHAFARGFLLLLAAILAQRLGHFHLQGKNRRGPRRSRGRSAADIQQR